MQLRQGASPTICLAVFTLREPQKTSPQNNPPVLKAVSKSKSCSIVVNFRKGSFYGQPVGPGVWNWQTGVRPAILRFAISRSDSISHQLYSDSWMQTSSQSARKSLHSETNGGKQQAGVRLAISRFSTTSTLVNWREIIKHYRSGE